MQKLTDKEFAWLQKIEAEIDKAWGELTEWEKKFTEDVLERFRKYGRRLLLTKYQWEKIRQISEKIIG